MDHAGDGRRVALSSLTRRGRLWIHRYMYCSHGYAPRRRASSFHVMSSRARCASAALARAPQGLGPTPLSPGERGYPLACACALLVCYKRYIVACAVLVRLTVYIQAHAYSLVVNRIRAA